jgi:uncharacterized membrane protein
MQFMHEDNETARIEAFSDGVFAIAITLLVLAIKVPNHASVVGRGLAHSLVALWPSYLAFFVSFITIFAIWVQHHWIFTHVRKIDHVLLYWNGLLLLVVTFIPFPSGLLAEHLPYADARDAAIMYTGTLLVNSLVIVGLWRHVSKNGRLMKASSSVSVHRDAAQITRYYQFAPLLYLAAFGLSFISEIAGVSSCILFAFLLSLPGLPTNRE